MAKAFSLSSRIQLSNGNTMPRISLGVYLMNGKECTNAVGWALETGYRGVDSAEMYGNERECGHAIRQFLSKHPTLDRSDIFFTTKLRSNTSYAATRRAIKASITRCGLEYLDLYLIHSPYGGVKTRLACWTAVEDAILDGEIKNGGVSNFGVQHLAELLAAKPRIKPAVNQIEVHPFNTRPDITSFCKKHDIVVEAYAPLVKGMKMKHPVIREMARKYEATPAQILIRWSLQKGYVPLPKSVSQARIEENAKVDGFEIEEDVMERLDSLDEYLVTGALPNFSACFC